MMSVETMEQIELSLADVVRINEAAPLMGCTVESLLRQAENDERLLYVALKPHTQTLFAIPSHPKPRQGELRTKQVMFVAMMSHDAASLATLGSAEISQYQAGFEPPLDWHYWMLDVPQTIGIDRVFVPRSQLPADVPAAVEQVTPAKTSPSDEEIPGKMPRTAIGKLAVKAAWQIECETQRPAIVDAVIKRLQEWVKHEDELLEIIKDGVRWQTKGCKANDFDIEACSKALERWHKSRRPKPTQGH